jgi:hypothetical protein
LATATGCGAVGAPSDRDHALDLPLGEEDTQLRRADVELFGQERGILAGQYLAQLFLQEIGFDALPLQRIPLTLQPCRTGQHHEP